MQARQRVSKNGKVLVTGGTGFIGSHLVEKLLEDEYDVRCIVRPGRLQKSWITGLPIESIECSLTDLTSLRSAMQGISAVIHVAGVTKAKRERTYVLGNVAATEALLKVAEEAGVGRFTFISSQTVVGPSEDGRPLTEDDPFRPITAYARSKRDAELLCRQFSKRFPLTILRPSAVYGPRDRDILEMFRWVGYGLRPLIGSSEKTLCLVHVHDLVDAIVKTTFDTRAAGRTYFVSDNTPYRFDLLMSLLSEITKKRTFSVRLPVPVLYTVAGLVQGISFIGPRPAVLSIDKARDMVQAYWVCTSERIERELGIRSGIKLKEGLTETYNWYLAQGWL